MKLMGRDLTPGLRDEDVRQLQADLNRLGFPIPLAETAEGFFGSATLAAVERLQEKHNLPVTGVVDRVLVERINRDVGAGRPTRASVSGTVRLADSTPASEIVVRAFHRDLHEEVLLGQGLTGAQGEYQIEYRADPSVIKVSAGVQLIVRAFNGLGLLLAASKIIRQAPSSSKVNLVITSTEEVQLSEYDSLIRTLTPLMGDLPLAGWTEDQIEFAAHTTGAAPISIRRLVEAGRLSEATQLMSPAVFYGLAVAGQIPDLDSLLDRGPDELMKALDLAVKRRIIPARLQTNRDAIQRMVEQLRFESGRTVVRSIRGRLTAEGTDRALAGLSVSVLDTRTVPPAVWDMAVTGPDGHFTIVIVDEKTNVDANRRFTFLVEIDGGREVGRQIAGLPVGDAILELRITDPAIPAPTLDSIAGNLNLNLPEGLLAKLTERGIRTIEELRSTGGFERLEGLPQPTLDMRTLESIAGLSALGDATAENALLVEAGFTSPSAIARAARVDFVGRTRPLGDFGAAKLQKQAKALDLVVRNAITADRLESLDFSLEQFPQRPEPVLPDSLADLFPSSCICQGCASADGPLAYLADLADYVVHNLQSFPTGSDTGNPISLEDLSARLHQPISELPASCEQIEIRVRQVRLAIETLRRLLTAAGLPPPGAAEEARMESGQRRYLEATYANLLGELGTSPEELRLALNDSEPVRRALLGRLGLDPEQPDQLDLLSLSGPTLTEPALERLFGLRDTTRDPFTEPATPELLDRRRARLRASWLTQDEATTTPAIDPDLIGPQYLRNPVAGDPAFDLWEARVEEIAAQLESLRQARSAAGNDSAWLESSFTNTLGTSGADLAAVAAQRAEGADISASVNGLNLTSRTFERLLRARRLAALGPLGEPEASAVMNILVQAFKRARFVAWRGEERAASIALSPDHFIIPPPLEGIPPPAPRELPEFRASESTLSTWRATLRTRRDEDRSLEDAIEAVIETVEEANLPRLRDALVDATGQDPDRLADTLLLDLQMDGCALTTRVGRAIETLQGLLWSVRTAQLNDVHPDLNLVDENFDVAWKWLESYDAWRAAMRVFLYPENILLPSLRSSRTPAFATLLNRSRALAPLSPTKARTLAIDYAAYLNDVANLQIGATCFALTYTEPSHPGRGAVGLRRVLHLFARASTSNAVYWSMFDPADRTSRAQSIWQRLPGLDKVSSIIGAVAFHVSPTRRHLYLFVTVEHESGQRLISTRLNLDGQPGAWDEEPTPIAVKDDATDFKVVLKLSKRATEAPELGLDLPRVNGKHDFYRGRLQMSGDALEVTDWQALRTNPPHTLLAMTSWGEDNVLLFTQNGSQLLFGIAPDTRILTVSLQAWKGALCWPGRDDNLVYAFWQDTQGLHYGGIWGNEEPVREPKIFTPAFLAGLDLVAPHTTIDLFTTQKQTLVYQRSGTTRSGIFISRIVQMQGAGITLRSRPEADPVENGPGVIALRRDIGVINPSTVGGTFDPNGDPPLPPDPPTPDPPPPLFIRLEEEEGLRAAPYLPRGLNITAPISENGLQIRRVEFAKIYRESLPSLEATRGVLDEAFYFVPVHLAQQLQQANHFSPALDWYRTVFDYSAPPGQRKIFDGLRREESLAEVLERTEDWLLDPLNPHEIAATRTNAYTRFTVLSIAGCFLDYADSEFTRDTSESVERARLLYDTALELLTPSNPAVETCAAMIHDLDEEIGGDIDGASDGDGSGGGGGPNWRGVWDRIEDLLEQVPSAEALRPIHDRIREVWDSSDSIPERLGRIHALASEAAGSKPSAQSLDEVLQGSEEVLARAHLRLSRTPAFASTVQRVSAVVGGDFGNAVSGVLNIPVADLDRDRTIAVPWLRERVKPLDLSPVAGGIGVGGGAGGPRPDVSTAGLLFGEVAAVAPLALTTSSQAFAPVYLTAPVFRFCVPANPEVDTLRRRASLNLYKIRTCRNIAGEVRELEPYPTGDEVLVGRRSGEDFASVPVARSFRPTPYRYAVLIDRAKQLVSFAQQTEAAFLGALERRDSEELGLMRARQDIQIARAGVRLHDLRVVEAEGGIRLSELQRNRALAQADYYADLLGESAFSLGSLLTMGAAAAITAVSVGSLGLGLVAAGASLFSSWSSNNQRQEEWERQLSNARQDVAIGNQQITVARDHVRVTEQERNISALHTEHAAVTAEFLANKFTSAELYDWMSRILEKVYRFFLQHATAIASLAESQLGFERQEVLPSFVQSDYWDARTGLEATTGSSGDGAAPDRRGVTGSARLLQDIFQLDQFAFQTDRRRLQLTKTISLAQLGPAEFQRFRETGTLRFDTPLEMFDRDFPGHFLRLVRRVRCTVIALIPPTGGIKATLANGGISRVVVPLADGFRTITVFRPPESVALSSPREATGLFELAPQPQEFLLPFEGIGVNTAWQLLLPRPSNRFDFETIADVLVTIEYTALDSPDYRKQVIRELDPRLGADRPFSFRHELADQWYDLNNPDQLDPADRMRVRFRTSRQDFPPNLEDFRIRHVALFFSMAPSQGDAVSPSLEIPITELRFTEDGGAPSQGGGATTIGRIASTELGNASAWLTFLGRSPFGMWELTLRDPLTDGRNLVEGLKSEEVTDILLIVSYSAELPDWPE